jgi:hypothetical protein
MSVLRRVWADLRARQNLDTYVVTAIAVVFAALGVVGDVVPEGLKWSAVFAALGLLVFRIAVPADRAATLDTLLADRDEFAEIPFPALLRDATELWIFAPTAINLLNAQHCKAIREHVLNKGNGDVRVAVLDPHNEVAVDLCVKQLDESLLYPLQDFRRSLATSVEQLRRMADWQVAGNFAFRFAEYNPGFSIVAIDPTQAHGRIVVEFHGYHNEAIGSRMHITLTRRSSERWYHYWAHQLDQIWSTARLP